MTSMLKRLSLFRSLSPARHPALPAVLAPVVLAVLAPAAMAQVDEGAKKLLSESSAAIKGLKAVTFNARQSLEGADPRLAMWTEGTVRFIRNQNAPSLSSFLIEGRNAPPAGQERKIAVAFHNGTGQWIHFGDKKFSTREAIDASALTDVKRFRDHILPNYFWESEPFSKELNAGRIQPAGEAEIRGVKCQVIRINSGRDGDTVLSIGPDKLPRRIVKEEPKIKSNWVVELWDIKANAELSESSVVLSAPEGFESVTLPSLRPKIERVETPPFVPQTDVNVPKLTITAGTEAPAWSLKNAAGQDVTLAGNKGKVVVLGFWSTIIGPSRQLLPALQELHATKAGEGVQVYAVAARDSDPDAAKTRFTQGQFAYGLLLGGNQVAEDYGIQAYPSAVVIDAQGRVAAVVTDFTSKDALTNAVKAAQGGK